MSFNIYVYGSDSGILQTDVFVYSSGSYPSISQSKSYDGNQSPLVISVPCDTGSTRAVRFQYTLASGATFSQWTYQIGGVSGASLDTTLVLNADSDIHIHADTTGGGGGGGGGGTWSAEYGGHYSNVSSTLSLSPTMQAGKMIVYEISFANAGTVTFAGGSHVYAYISSSQQSYPNTGEPVSVITSDTSGSDNFSLSCQVSANTSYYFWTRMPDISWSGSCNVTITPPSGGGGGDGGVHIFNGSSWVHATPYIFNGSRWVQATPYIFNGTTWVKAT